MSSQRVAEAKKRIADELKAAKDAEERSLREYSEDIRRSNAEYEDYLFSDAAKAGGLFIN